MGTQISSSMSSRNEIGSGFTWDKIFQVYCQSGVYIFFCLTPAPGQKYDQITGWGKKLLEGDKKGGEMHIYPQLVKSMHIFPPIDLKYTKLQKKGLQFLS